MVLILIDFLDHEKKSKLSLVATVRPSTVVTFAATTLGSSPTSTASSLYKALFIALGCLIFICIVSAIVLLCIYRARSKKLSVNMMTEEPEHTNLTGTTIFDENDNIVDNHSNKEKQSQQTVAETNVMQDKTEKANSKIHGTEEHQLLLSKEISGCKKSHDSPKTFSMENSCNNTSDNTELRPKDRITGDKRNLVGNSRSQQRNKHTVSSSELENPNRNTSNESHNTIENAKRHSSRTEMPQDIDRMVENKVSISNNQKTILEKERMPSNKSNERIKENTLLDTQRLTKSRTENGIPLGATGEQNNDTICNKDPDKLAAKTVSSTTGVNNEQMEYNENTEIQCASQTNRSCKYKHRLPKIGYNRPFHRSY